jgi:outer membrane protein
VKNLSLILNGVLIIAVGILFFLHFSHKTRNSGSANSETSAGIRDVTIAYVIEDSLLTRYQMFKDLSSDLEKKSAAMEKDFNSRGQSLQTEIENFKTTSGNMTMNQAKAVQDDLILKQQHLAQYQESLNQQLMAEQAKINDKLFQSVSDFLNVYAAQKGYQIVLNFKRGTGMLYGTDTLNITDAVIEGLNAKYMEEKAAAKSNPKSDSTKARK